MRHLILTAALIACQSAPGSEGGRPCPDADNDSVCDENDVCDGSDDLGDLDQDGRPDGCDPCPRDPDDDADRDGVCGDEDKCPGGDDREDVDRDTVPDECDNCPRHKNTDQGDTDRDGYGNRCDRPDEDNDVLLVSVSGHSFDPRDTYNPEYLFADEDRLTVDPVLAFFDERGMKARLLPIADAFYDESDEDLGFLTMLDVLMWVQDTWVADYENPTRIVFLAHSHGCVWAHNILFELPDLPVDVLVDLDAESTAWEDDVLTGGFGDQWYWMIQDYEREYGRFNADIKNSADAFEIPGQPSFQDVEDVVPDNVLINLEVKAQGWSPPFANDDERNHRLDGSTGGVRFHHSVGEGHTEILNHDSRAMSWVVNELRSIYR